MNPWDRIREALREIVNTSLDDKTAEYGSLEVAGPRTVQHLTLSLDQFKVEVVQMVHKELIERQRSRHVSH